MKKLLFLAMSFCSFSIFASEAIFTGEVLQYSCDYTDILSDNCIVTVKNSEYHLGDRGPEYVAVLLDLDFDYEVGRYINPNGGAFVRVDLTYTEKVDNKSALNYLRKTIGEEFEFYQHLSTSHGSYNDVINVLRID